MTAPQTGIEARSIALIGPRGAGKTTVGRELAGLAALSHMDTDELVVQGAGRSIADIFAEEGEAGFRQRESDAIREALAAGPTVISVGGGAVLDSCNVEALRASATVVWLTAPAEVLWRRTASDPATSASRPPLTPLSGRDEVEQLLVARAPLYQAAADFTIDTSDRRPLDIAQEIWDRLRSTT
jgi:shikimate kinase